MACGCGGSTGGGGCGGGGARPEVEVPDDAALFEELPPEEGRSETGEALLIASSEQEWPLVRVNGVEIATQAIAQELQYHPAESRDEAVYLAVQALVLRELLQQRITELGLLARTETGESEEEAAIRVLIEREVPLPLAGEEACRTYYTGNAQRFFSAPLLAVRHILLACPADDAEARSLAREQALALLGQLGQAPQRFAELALQHSACPSKAQGGALGQISKGQTVPEFERQLFRLPVGLCQQPLESRYGYHLVAVDQRIEGEQLPYEVVAGSIRAELNQRVWQIGVAQYLQNLVGAASIEGIHMQGAETPLMQ
ncbi:peptidylprolyl isomerase [Stutzerimonas xanthomarina]|uniref:peptidylprolyl isomerase n=1 Tax=Stutzerimonas nitrititolerans TaxID=2482751 RepID=UPI000825985F|nr:peptidylprolyl isomerase [Stutzerimonas nitrititolerans]OCX15254.1 peptidylprolyl isomerase [Stutzerimonas xanthomarina]HBB78614.1 peptidylprolyl isomerase [Pseudomonas sp.]